MKHGVNCKYPRFSTLFFLSYLEISKFYKEDSDDVKEETVKLFALIEKTLIVDPKQRITIGKYALSKMVLKIVPTFKNEFQARCSKTISSKVLKFGKATSLRKHPH